MSRKTRSDSVLGTLPADRQDAIADYALGHSLAETIDWLRADGIRTSSRGLSVWLSSWRLQQTLRRNEATVETLLEDFRKAKPDASLEEIRSVGQSFFSALALQEQDPKIWAMTQGLALKRDELELSRKKFQRETAELFLKWWNDKRATEIASSDMSNAEKLEQLGQQMFGDLWE